VPWPEEKEEALVRHEKRTQSIDKKHETRLFQRKDTSPIPQQGKKEILTQMLKGRKRFLRVNPGGEGGGRRKGGKDASSVNLLSKKKKMTRMTERGRTTE